MKTGYFAKDDGSKRTEVHIVDEVNIKPLCNEFITPDYSTFQYCSTDVNLIYVECEGCKKIYKKTKDLEKEELIFLLSHLYNSE